LPYRVGVATLIQCRGCDRRTNRQTSRCWL